MVEQNILNNILNNIYHDIRNMRTLSQEQMNIIQDLSHNEKMEIINLLNTSMQYLSDLLLENNDNVLNSTLHTRK